MRHHNANRKFGRKTDQRAALLRSLARELFLHGKIVTTEAKAKEVRPFAEELITIARVGDLASKRLVAARLANNIIVKKLVDIIAPEYIGRNGGYTRVIKLERRPADGAKMAAIELVK
jgi:large subunit ribosomal protein L17